MPTFYERFSQLASRNGYSSPTALGEELGFSSSLVSTWKVRKARPRMNTISTIANKFGVSPEWLSGEAVDINGNPVREEPSTKEVTLAIGRNGSVGLYVPRYETKEPAKPVTQHTFDANKVINGALAILLFGDEASLVTPEDLDEIRDYAQVVLNRRKRKG